MIDIDKKLTASSLAYRLQQIKCTEADNSLLDILYRLMKDDLFSSTPFDDIQIVKEDVVGITISEHTNNIEIIARWSDLMQHFKIDVPRNCLLAYDYYMQVYAENKQWEYAFRAFLIVKFKKGIFKDKLSELEKDFSTVLRELNNPRPYKTIVSVLTSILNKEKFVSQYVSDIDAKLQDCIDNKRYDDAICYVETLELIGKINVEECKKRKSLILEQNADYIVANKKENTFYPSIVNLYQKALCEIASLKDCEEGKQRLSRKLLTEQEELAKGMQLIGKCTGQRINLQEIYDRIVFECKIDNPFSAYKAMMSFPIISDDWIISQREDSKKNYSFLHESFSKYVQNNVKGATIGIAEGDQAIDNSIRRIAEFLFVEYLKIFFHIIHCSGNCDIDEKFIHGYLIKLNSRFIPQDRMLLFTQGLYFGFKGDFSLAAHVLLPQIENSFRYIAQQHGIITTKLAEVIQHENTMGGILEKIKPHTETDLWQELNHFLVDGVGFRNGAMHGLLSHREIYHYGIYLWWLCLKIIYNTDRYFGFK